MRTPPRFMPALVTPFDQRGEVALEDHRHNVATLTERGVTGLVIAGSTGEGPYLEPGEREQLVAAARQTAPDSFVMCGVAGQSVRQALDQAQEAARGGADAVLVLTPAALILGKDDLVESFYEQLAASSRLPILLYTFGRVTGHVLPPQAIGRLSALDSVKGIKDSNGVPGRFAEMVASGVAADFSMYAGSSPVLADSLHNGATGAITASGNYAPTLVAQVVEDGATRDSAQQHLTDLVSVVEAHGLAGTKAAASIAGLRSGEVRAPVAALSDDARRRIGDVVASRAR